MDCVIYIRWSSAEQSKGTSLERQRADCRAHAKRHGWKVVQELIDDGVSAFKGRHASVGMLGGFVDAVENGEYPAGIALLVEKLDRLSREEPGRVFLWMMRMTEAGVTIATVDGDRRYARGTFDMATIIEVVVKAQLSHEESAKKASRLAAAWAAKRAKVADGQQLVMTRRAPAWLAVEGTPPRFVLIDDRAAIVRRIYEETVAGLGKHTIARRLNAEGVPTFGRASGWHSSYIQKILTTATVLGAMQPGSKARGEARTLVGDPIEGYYPAVVDADLHASAAAAMAGRSRRVAGKGRSLVNLFSGLGHCGACGSKMTFRGKGLKQRANGAWVQEDYLICDSYQRGRGCIIGNHFNYAVWQTGILDAILHDAMQDRHFASRGEVRPLEVELAERVRQRAASSTKQETALKLLVETDRPEVKAMWLRLVAEVDAQDKAIVDLRDRLVAARGAVSPDEHRRRIRVMRSRLDDPDEEVRFATRSAIMAAVHELVESIEFKTNPDGVDIRTKQDELVVVGWEEHADGQAGLGSVKVTPPPA